jgi:cell division protein FtsI/penicillin-binding protein 2
VRRGAFGARLVFTLILPCLAACPRARLDEAERARTAIDARLLHQDESLVSLRAALEGALVTTLPSRDDGAALLSLESGRLLHVHHPDVIFERPIAVGSVMKLFTATALVENGHGDAAVSCTGTHRDAFGIERACWLRAGHGEMRLRTAIASSCNVYFYDVSARLDARSLTDTFARFAFGAPFANDIVRARRDELPIAVAPRDVVDVAVGDDLSMRVTPLSLLRAITPFATGGMLVEPSLDGRGAKSRARIDVAALALVEEGMREAVRSGTLAGVFADDDVVAKTGTAKREGARATRGVVIGYAPRDAPEVAFVVVRDRGRGAHDAGPAARALVDTWRAHVHPDVAVPFGAFTFDDGARP